jgi:hypothetical protein
MFERLAARAGRLGEKRAAQAARRIAAAAAAEAAPDGVRVDEIDGGVRLSGRGLGQRMLREPALRWLVGRVT